MIGGLYLGEYWFSTGVPVVVLPNPPPPTIPPLAGMATDPPGLLVKLGSV